MEGLKLRGRPPIHYAESVKGVVQLSNPYAQAILDRSQPIDDLIDSIIGQSVFQWEGRNPAPALDPDGNFVGTDLDLFSFLVPIAERHAVIRISSYTNRRKRVVRADQRKVGTAQFGPIIGLISNRKTFSFSARIKDMSIHTTHPDGRETIGAPRTYMLVDLNGKWYKGWDHIEWDPTAAENAFLNERSLWTGNTVYFKNYVHPYRWQSVFGAPYLLLKMLVERLTDEAKFYYGEAKRLSKLIAWPESEHDASKDAEDEDSVAEGPSQKIKVPTLEMVLDTPSFTGTYPTLEPTPANYALAYRRGNLLRHTIAPIAKFVVRADEAAYYQYGMGLVASWMGTRKWQAGWKRTPRSAEWNKMMLSNDCALRYRYATFTQEVSA